MNVPQAIAKDKRTPTPRAAAYIRVSTEEQTEYSPESQMREISRYATREGMLLLPEHIYRDVGISGRRACNRPAFVEMIRAASERPRPFDYILVWKFSRFSRSRNDSILYKARLKKHGIRVISVSEPLKEDPTSLLMEAMLEAMDEYYSINLGQEVRRGMEEKFLRGGVVSIPPFGYTVENGRFVAVEHEAQAIATIFGEASKGASLRAIAQMLNDSGICTKRGGHFHAREVGYILRNPFYVGCQRRGGRVVSGSQKPLISKELFDLVQTRLRPLKGQEDYY